MDLYRGLINLIEFHQKPVFDFLLRLCSRANRSIFKLFSGCLVFYNVSLNYFSSSDEFEQKLTRVYQPKKRWSKTKINNQFIDQHRKVNCACDYLIDVMLCEWGIDNQCQTGINIQNQILVYQINVCFSLFSLFFSGFTHSLSIGN